MVVPKEGKREGRASSRVDLDFVVDREGRKDNDDDDNEVLSLVGEKGRVSNRG